MSAADPGGDPASRLAPLLEENLDDLYENAPCGYVSTLADGTVVRVNETFLRWTGHGRDDLVDRVRMHELLAPGDRIFYETHYAPLLQMQGAVREIAVELVRADGSRMPVLMNAVLRRDDNGVEGIIRATIFDATERRGYERELLRARREAEERARAAEALAHVDDGVLVVDLDGRVAVANPAAETILGLGTEAHGAPVRTALEGWAELEPHVPVGRPGAPANGAVLPLRRGRREQWLWIVGVDAGHGVVYTIRDVTADRRLETMRDELISVVSHELRTPLTGVYGAASTLLAHRTLPEEQRDQLLSMIVDQAQRLARIVDDVLLTRRLDAGDAEPARDEFDLAGLAAATAAEVAGALGQAPRVQVECPSPVPVAGDRGWARQALANLVENALKYSPAGSTIQVRVGATARHGRVDVTDEGPGIPQPERDRVWERFYRLDPALSRGVGGVGLGLFVARELVERMDGRIELESGDDGSTFTIELPLAGS